MSTVPQYLVVIYRLATTEGEPVASGAVAAELGRSPSTTTEMLQRLDDRGLLIHEPYTGVRLTDEGRATAADLHDSYLVLRRFFATVLDLDDPDTEALELAGSVSPLVTERLASTVLADDPTDAQPTGHDSGS